MPKIVVNSTPLIILCNIDKLSILKELYGEVCVPEAVFNEVTAKPDTACLKLKEANNWIKIIKIPQNEKLKIYRARLHSGEVEVMILAQKEPIADLVIIDDNAAKTTANFLGLKVTGTLGVLLKAKKEGLIKEIKPLIKTMKELGFYISDKIEQLIITLSGEDDEGIIGKQ